MLNRLIFLIEFFTICVGIFRIFGRKFKIDISVILFVLGSLLIQEIITRFGITEINTIIFGVLIYEFCKIKFKETILQTMTGVILLSIVMTIIQFICAVLTGFLLPNQELLRALCINMEVLLLFIYLIPKMKLDKLKKNIKWKNRYTLLAFGFAGIILIFLLLQSKFWNGIRIDHFMLLIPAIMVLFWGLIKWTESQQYIEMVETEIKSNAIMENKYDKFLMEVRIRQHEFKNHIAAVFSAHYTYKTYEQLVKAQTEYCNTLQKDNRYNNLLLIGNRVLAGFLYEKFCEIEDEDIELQYKITTSFENLEVPTYHLIEIIGILINNAVEALKYSDEKEIYFEATENHESCCLKIRNVHNYVSYSVMEQWFQLSVSSKGEGRGLGLFHVKSLCEEWKCRLFCENIEIENKNWILFTIEFDKKDSRS